MANNQTVSASGSRGKTILKATGVDTSSMGDTSSKQLKNSSIGYNTDKPTKPAMGSARGMSKD